MGSLERPAREAKDIWKKKIFLSCLVCISLEQSRAKEPPFRHFFGERVLRLASLNIFVEGIPPTGV